MHAMFSISKFYLIGGTGVMLQLHSEIQSADRIFVFYRPINIILSADWSDYTKDITRRLPKSVKISPKTLQSADRRPTVGRRSADISADDKWGAKIGR